LIAVVGEAGGEVDVEDGVAHVGLREVDDFVERELFGVQRASMSVSPRPPAIRSARRSKPRMNSCSHRPWA
jgi:hypothetical protein